MIWSDIKKYAALKTALINTAGDYVDGLVTDEDLDFYGNEIYKELFMRFAEKFPEHFEVTSYAPITVDVGKYKIGGDAADHLEFKWVGIKYSSTATEYKRVKRIERSIAFSTDDDRTGFSQTAPKYLLSAVKTAIGEPTERAMEILPAPDATVADGLELVYIEIPLDLTNSDTPSSIPSTAHKLIANYLIADIWETKGDNAKADKALLRAEEKEQKFFENYQPKASDTPANWSPDRSFSPYRRRR